MERQWREEEVWTKTRSMIAERTGIAAYKIGLNSDFKNDLGMCSIDQYEFIFSAEKEFGISISDWVIIGMNIVEEFFDNAIMLLGPRLIPFATSGN